MKRRISSVINAENCCATVRRLNPHLFPNENRTQTPLQNPKHAQQAGALDGYGEGEASFTGCPVVRFTLFRVSLLDVDAKWSSVKDLLDGLQYAGLIPGDKEGQITLEVTQKKVAHFAEENTEICIEGEIFVKP